ncbi:hypothetical protein SAMN05444360_10675 [Chryseobacterium carnipullorum]|uniref:hypothetical protein n=1 Tax=Chryseobacterium carnipullorum TaxID=1124835 RepID=UPI00091AB779|nr:hypothetical protein [Chryseobacterium carnipullorum]SHL94492.1 hypothetical protein SAMN05444360_10675 [Chryseobacterium carnipullorum]
MKKLLFIGALALSTVTFANTKEEVKSENKQEVKTEKAAEVKELTPAQKEALASYFRWWSVAFKNACGSTTTVLFQSDNPDMSPGFNDELAYAVNSNYDNC